jgi:hypothetical protein
VGHVAGADLRGSGRLLLLGAYLLVRVPVNVVGGVVGVARLGALVVVAVGRVVELVDHVLLVRAGLVSRRLPTLTELPRRPLPLLPRHLGNLTSWLVLVDFLAGEGGVVGSLLLLVAAPGHGGVLLDALVVRVGRLVARPAPLD